MPVFRIEVAPKKSRPDLLGLGILGEICSDLSFFGIEQLRTASLFEINANLGDEAIMGLCGNLFVDPITDEFSVNSHLFEDFDFCLEVGFLSGVTDNVGLIAKRGIEDFLGKKLGEAASVKSKKLYFFWGKLFEENVREIAVQKLFNSLIEEIRVHRGKKGDLPGFAGGWENK